MLPGHLRRLPAYAALLFLVSHVSAGPTKLFPNDPQYQDTSTYCPFPVEVGHGHGLARVTLQDTLEFSLKPNMPVMSMEFVGDGVLYKALVSGTTVQLLKCDAPGHSCETVTSGGTKDRDLLVPNEWNKIYVNYNYGEISVDVNMKASVMGGHMTMSKGSTKSSHVGQVTFVVPPTKPFYHAYLEIPCSDGLPEIQTELPILPPAPTGTTTTRAPHPVFPYDECPVYMVETNHPATPAALMDNLTLAVYPSHPSLHLIITNEFHYFKVQVHDSSMKLLECQVTGRECVLKKEAELSIEPEKWNFVTIFLQDDKIFISIRVNNREGNVLMTPLPSSSRRGLTVMVYAQEQSKISHDRDYYQAFVNVKCEVIEQKMVTDVFPFTTKPASLATNAPIVESTTEPTTTTGFSRELTIVVAVLVGVLLLIILAIIISTVVKKRRSAAINEQSPLQDQFQQQY